MEFIDYYTESGKQNGCTGTEWLRMGWLLTLVILWLPGSCTTAQQHNKGSHCLSLAQDKSQIQNPKYSFYWKRIIASTLL